MLLLFITGKLKFSDQECQTIFNNLKKNKYETILIPGAPFKNDGSENLLIKRRIKWGIYLIKEGIGEKLYLSGGAIHTAFVEAEIFKAYLIKNNLNPSDLVVDGRAEHSSENILNFLAYISKEGIKKAAIATDAAQAKRMAYYLKIHEIHNIDILPIVEDRLKFQLIDLSTEEIKELKINTFTDLSDKQNIWHRLKGKLGI